MIVLSYHNDLQLDEQKINLLKEFLLFCKKELQINGDINVKLVLKDNGLDITTGGFRPDTHEIFAVAEGRSLLQDVTRTISHELQHYKQNEEGRIQDATKDGADGSDIENEANIKAGIIMRKFGRLYPEIHKI